MSRALALAARGLGRDEPQPRRRLRDREGRPRGGRGLASPRRRPARRGRRPGARGGEGPRARRSTSTSSPAPTRAARRRARPCWREAGIRRVVAALRDPDPRVDGRGIALLRRAGIEVDGRGAGRGGGGPERALHRGRARGAAPTCTLKAATTLDGRIATARRGIEVDHEPRAAPRRAAPAAAARRRGGGHRHGPRRRSHAAAAAARPPSLLPRRLRLAAAHPAREPSGALRSARRRSGSSARGRDARKKAALERQGVTVVEQPSRGGPGVPAVGPPRAVAPRDRAASWSRAARSCWARSWPRGLVDAVALYRAPLILGGREGVPAFGGPAPARLADALALRPARPPQGRASRASAALVELWYPVASR